MDTTENSGLPQPTLEKAKTITPINKDVVHRICSGQVVLSLAIAVKELVENSLDAGATLIEVRLKEYGIDLVEVSDNGSGVVEENFAALTLKYHTSKLRNFSDLVGITSFGFRGEALSSLCALSDLIVTTRHRSATYATKISYDHKGEIKNTVPCSRQIGTTVTLSNLFSTLPVRQKEFHKNIKREFARMTHILYAYCLVSVGVKIICTNQTKKGSKSIVVATQGSKTIRDNISCVFGIKQLDSLLPLKSHTPVSYVPNLKDKLLSGFKCETIVDSEVLDDLDIHNNPPNLSDDSEDAVEIEPSSTQLNLQLNEELMMSSSISLTPESQERSAGHDAPIDFDGFVSSCAHGLGRSTSDRQYYYVNSRPCEPAKIIKLFNEVYRQYNPNQYPFIFLNLKIKGSSVDVNVTPDKRQVFLDREKHLLDFLKLSLQKIYQNIPSTLRVINENIGNKIVESRKPTSETNKSMVSFMSKFANRTVIEKKDMIEEINNEKKRKANALDTYINSNKTIKIDTDDVKEQNVYVDNSSEIQQCKITDNVIQNYESLVKTETSSEDNENQTKENIHIENEIINLTENLDKREVVYLSFSDTLPNTQIRTVDEVVSSNLDNTIKIHKKEVSRSKIKNGSNKSKCTDEGMPASNRKVVNIKTSMEHIKSLLVPSEGDDSMKIEKVKFKATIGPGTNMNCEQELQKELSKDMFLKMRIIGQFNLGFIITELNNDLFIVDQHATDEKYNFETLQKTTVLTNQRLVVPQQLDLTGVNEQILMESLDIFKKNGFTFEIDENAPPTKKVKLLTIPMSNNWVFGKDDIEELIFMLKEAEPAETCRPSRVRSMFASRACRKSVMIGMALSRADMRKLIDHMGMIEQPWNCPHGRPTIRHLINLALTTR